MAGKIVEFDAGVNINVSEETVGTLNIDLKQAQKEMDQLQKIVSDGTLSMTNSFQNVKMNPSIWQKNSKYVSDYVSKLKTSDKELNSMVTKLAKEVELAQQLEKAAAKIQADFASSPSIAGQTDYLTASGMLQNVVLGKSGTSTQVVPDKEGNVKLASSIQGLVSQIEYIANDRSLEYDASILDEARRLLETYTARGKTETKKFDSYYNEQISNTNKAIEASYKNYEAELSSVISSGTSGRVSTSVSDLFSGADYDTSASVARVVELLKEKNETAKAYNDTVTETKQLENEVGNASANAGSKKTEELKEEIEGYQKLSMSLEELKENFEGAKTSPGITDGSLDAIDGIISRIDNAVIGIKNIESLDAGEIKALGYEINQLYKTGNAIFPTLNENALNNQNKKIVQMADSAEEATEEINLLINKLGENVDVKWANNHTKATAKIIDESGQLKTVVYSYDAVTKSISEMESIATTKYAGISESLAKLKSDFSDADKTSEFDTESIDKYQSKIQELEATLNSGNLSQSQLKTITQDIVNLSSILSKTTTNKGGLIKGIATDAEEAAVEIKKLVSELSESGKIFTNQTTSKNGTSFVGTITNSLKETEKIAISYNAATGAIEQNNTVMSSSFSKVYNNVQHLSDAFDRLKLEGLVNSGDIGVVDNIVNQLSGEKGHLNSLLSDDLNKETLDAITQDLKNFESTYKKMSDAINSEGKLGEDKFVALASNAVEAQSKMEGIISTFGKNVNISWLDNATKATATFVDQAGNLRTVTLQYDAATKSISQNTKTVNSNTNAWSKMGNGISDATKSLLAGFGIRDAFYAGVREIQEGFTFVNEMDDALTTISMTMPTTEANLRNLGSAAIDMAQDMRVSVDSVSSIAEIYANTTETSAEILRKAEPTIMLSTASGLDVTTAADVIQGITMQYTELQGMETHVVDSIEKISANLKKNFGEGIEDMATGIQKTGAVAREAGMDYETLAASIGVVAEVSRQTGDTIGNAYKTIFSRISRATDPDEEALSSGEVSAISKAYSSIGINVYDADGQFQDITKTIDQLAMSWDTLTDAERSYIAEQSAGVRQKNVFITMMDNWERIQALSEEATNDSAGFGLENQEKYAESLSGQMALLTAQAQEFWYNFLDADAVGGIIEGISAIVGGLTSLSDLMGSIPTIATLIGGILPAISGVGVLGSTNSNGVFKTHDFKNTIDGIKGFFTSGGELNKILNSDMDSLDIMKKLDPNTDAYKAQFKGLSQSAKDYVTNLNGATISTDNYKKSVQSAGKVVNQTGKEITAMSTSAKIANGAMKVLNIAASALATAFISIAISAAWDFIDKQINKTKYLAEAADEAAEAIKGIESTYKSQADLINTDAEAFERLSKGVDGLTNKNISLSDEDYEEYLRISNDLVELFPSINGGLDSQGNAMVDLADDVSSVTAALKELLSESEKQAAMDILDQSQDIYNKFNDELVNKKNKYDEDLLLSDYEANGVEALRQSMPNSIWGFPGVALSTPMDIINQELEKGNFLKYLENTGSQSEYNGEIIKSINALIIADEKVNSAYMTMQDSQKEILSSMISNTNWQEIFSEGISEETISDYLNNDLLPAFSTIGNESSSALEELFADNFGDLNISDPKAYVEKVRELENQIKSEIENTFGAGSDQAEAFTLNFKAEGLEDIISRFEESQKVVMDSSNFSSDFEQAYMNEFLTSHGTFSLEQMEMWLSISGSAEGAVDAVSKYNALIAESAMITSADISMDISGYAEQLTSLQELMMSGQTINIETYESLGDYAEALEQSGDLLTLNADKVAELNKEKTEEIKANLAVAKAQDALNYEALIHDIKQLEGLSGDEYSGQLESLRAQKDSLDDVIKGYDILFFQMQQANSAFTTFTNAQSSADTGDNYGISLEAMQAIQDGFDTGKYGTVEFDAALNLLIPEGSLPDINDAEAYIDAVSEYYNNVLKRYFREDDTETEGVNEQSLGVQTFIEDALANGSFTGDLGNFEVAKNSIADVAEAFGMTEDAVISMFGIIEEYTVGRSFDWSKNLGLEDRYALELQKQADLLLEREELLQNGESTYDIDAEIDNSNEAINNLHEEAEEIINDEDHPDYEVAMKIKEGTYNKTQSEIDSLRESLVEAYNNEDIDAFSAIQSEIDKIPPVIQSKYYLDTSEAQNNFISLEGILGDLELGIDAGDEERVTNISDALLSLPESKQIALDIQGLNTEDLSSLILGDENFLEELMVKIEADVEGEDTVEGLSSSLLDGVENAEDLRKKLDAISKASVNVPGLSGVISQLNTASYYATVLYNNLQKVNGASGSTTTTNPTGPKLPSGSYNSAMSEGTNSKGVSKDQTALVNEIGSEILVRDGQWQIIPGGAQFMNLKKGDIIFSHDQSKQLLTNGSIPTQGKAFASGTSVSGGGSWLPARPSSSSSSSSGSSSSSSSNSSYNSAANQAEDTAEKIDWIERAIKKAEEAIQSMATIADSVYKMFSTRNSALVKQYELVADKIELNEKAYVRYLQEANSLGLDAGYASKVRDGTIDIESITDENLRALISEYQQWYDKAVEVKLENEELYETLSDIASTKFDNIISEYDAQIDRTTHIRDSLDSYIDLAEAQGRFISNAYYDAQQGEFDKDLDTLSKEREALIAQFHSMINNGDVEQGSEKWNEMKSEIEGVDRAIVETMVNIEELNKTMLENDWSYFDRMQDQISNIASESQFLFDLLRENEYFTENGQDTDTFVTAMGLVASNYNVYQKQAEEYADAILDINEKLANDPNNLLLIDRKQELIEAQQSSILAAEAEKDAMIDLRRQGYEAQLEYLNELIEAKKNSLNEDKELYEYQKNVQAQTENINALKKQLLAYEGDDSEAGRLNYQNTQNQLEDAEQGLQDTEYDRYVAEQAKILDQVSSDFEEAFNERLDNIDAVIQEEIEYVNANADSIRDTISEEANEVGYMVSDSIDGIWADGNPVTLFMNKWADNTANTLGVITGIGVKIDEMVRLSKVQAGEDISDVTSSSDSVGNPPAPPTPSTPPTTSTPNTGDSSSSGSDSSSGGTWNIPWVYSKDYYPKNKLNINTSIIDRLKYHDFSSTSSNIAKYYAAMGGSGSWRGTASQNTWMISEMKKHGYAKGGTIGSMIKASGEDGFVLARTGEEILSIPKLEIMKEMFEKASQVLNTPAYENRSSNSSSSVEINVEKIELPNVTNPKEFGDNFIKSLQENNTLKSALKTFTESSLMGKNELSINKFKTK